jgi:hypothetical protein
LSFTPDELAAIEGWMKRARPLAGSYYRSVEYQYMDPSDVLSGTGTSYTEAGSLRWEPVRFIWPDRTIPPREKFWRERNG